MIYDCHGQFHRLVILLYTRYVIHVLLRFAGVDIYSTDRRTHSFAWKVYMVTSLVTTTIYKTKTATLNNL